jgi:hypothetical protein
MVLGTPAAVSFRLMPRTPHERRKEREHEVAENSLRMTSGVVYSGPHTTITKKNNKVLHTQTRNDILTKNRYQPSRPLGLGKRREYREELVAELTSHIQLTF